MKNQISLLLCLGCACAVSANFSVARAQDAAVVADAPLSASQILTKSRQTYAAFSSYKGSCSVVRDVLFAVDDNAPQQGVSSASAQIEFERGKLLTIEGVDMGGSPFRAQWTPREAYIEQVKRGETIAAAGEIVRTDYQNKPNFRAADGLMAGLSGFTGGTGSQIPNALMPDNFDLGNPFSSLGTAKLLPARSLGNVPCYVIEQTVPTLNSVTTYYIEQKTFLLRRLTEEMGEQRYDDLPLIDGKKMPIMRVAYSQSQFVFATTEAK